MRFRFAMHHAAELNGFQTLSPKFPEFSRVSLNLISPPSVSSIHKNVEISINSCVENIRRQIILRECLCMCIADSQCKKNSVLFCVLFFITTHCIIKKIQVCEIICIYVGVCNYLVNRVE